MSKKLIDTESFLLLMQEVLNTNSPSTRLNALYEFLLKEPDFLSLDERNTLTSAYKLAKETKSAAGKAYAQKRKSKEKKSFPAGTWLFIPKSRYMGTCEGCREKYFIDDPVFVQDKNGYHVECTPADVRDNHPLYKKYLLSKEVN